MSFTLPPRAFGQAQIKITLDDAIQLGLQHNHNLLAARTTIQQSEAQEITANLKPNPTFFADWEYLPLFTPSYWNSTYLEGTQPKLTRVSATCLSEARNVRDAIRQQRTSRQ
jgi:hypothetical protein